MFPEEFVSRQLLTFTRPGDLVLDPFCGRGTTVLESLIQNRRAIGSDVNWVAACVAGAKASVPSAKACADRIQELVRKLPRAHIDVPTSEFFNLCFHSETLREVSFLRRELDWRNSTTDRFLAAVALGALHGESHRSPNYFSNRMPRTISTKPDYSVRWWRSRRLLPERRNVFDILKRLVAFRLSVAAPTGVAKVVLGDARVSDKAFKEFSGQVRLIVTSPPYLDTTDYAEDQWLRLWFLGGEPMPVRRLGKDDRYREPSDYWKFLEDVWRGCAPLLAENATIVVRIGGRKLSVADLTDGLLATLRAGLPHGVKLLSEPLTSDIKNGQLNSFRPGASARSQEHDFAFRLGKRRANSSKRAKVEEARPNRRKILTGAQGPAKQRRARDRSVR